MKKGKKYQEASKLIEKDKFYEIGEAIDLVKKTSYVNFDASVDVAFNLNLDTRHVEQQLRGAIVLPNGTGKTKRILAITTKTKEAQEAGADIVGGKEEIEKIRTQNWFDFDVIVATPEMMGELGKIGKILGPKGLMPNPKIGTVTTDIAKAINEIKAGKIEYRTDKEGNINLSIGRVSFSEKKLKENYQAIYDVILRSRPSVVKGNYFKNISIASSMGPGVKIKIN